MSHESKAEQWWAKAQRAEEQAYRAKDTRTADIWFGIACVYRGLAARNEAWESAWKPRQRGTSTEERDKGRPS